MSKSINANVVLDEAKCREARILWDVMQKFVNERVSTNEPLTRYMRCPFHEFVTILHDFTLDDIIDARAYVEADEWESCEAVMCVEGGFDGYYWRVSRAELLKRKQEVKT